MEQIQIIPTDTAESIFLRMAAKLASLPQYLHMTNVPVMPGRAETRLGQQSVVDVPQIIKHATLKTGVVDMFTAIRTLSDVKTFSRFLAANITLFPNLSLKESLKDAIIKPWLYHHIDVANIEEDYLALVVFSAVDTINRALGKEVDINTVNFAQEQSDALADFSNTIAGIQRRNAEIVASYRQVESVPHTEFELEKTKHAITISTNYTFTLQEIFDSVILSNLFPFAHLYINSENYYKVYKDFIPREEWMASDSQDSQIIVKFLTAPVGEKKLVYEDIRVVISEGKCIVLLDISIGKEGERAIVDNVLRIFQRTASDIITEERVSIKGVFYIPHQTMNNYIFSHLVMNDINFSTLVIDEVGKPTKAKTGMYIYYRTQEMELSEATSLLVTPKLMDRFDQSMKDKSPTLFPEDKPYIRIRITAKNEAVIKDIQTNMARMVALYNYNFQNVLALYTKYIPTFLVEKTREVRKLGAKSSMAGSKRHCTHLPIVISPEDADRYTDTMIFPLPGDPDNKNPGKMYACEISGKEKKSNLKYVGLQLRKETGNYEPCCYQTDQKEKSGSDYNKYVKYIETGEKMKKNVGKKQQRLITTNKILDYTDVSELLIHESVYRLLALTDPGTKHYRSGTYRSKMSMIGCLLEIMRKANEKKISEGDLLAAKTRIANTPALLALCKQSLPTKSIAEIREYILGDIYFDPRIFTDVLEEYFDCRIYTFGEVGMISPEYKKNYLKYKDSADRARAVFLIEHFGSESDHATTPQCEFVYGYNDEFKYYFESASSAGKLLGGIAKRMTRSYFLNTKIEYFKRLSFAPIKQRFDSLGKVCAFAFKTASGVAIAYTKRPYPPLPIAEMVDSDAIVIPGADEVHKIFGGAQNARGVVETDEFVVPIARRVKAVVPRHDAGPSILGVFNMYAKLASYIREYFLYAYSWYLADTGSEIGVASISAFSTAGVTINNDAAFSYGDISKFFSKNNTMYSGGRVVVPSVEILKSCIYVLRLEVARNPEKVLAYRDRKNIFSFIENVTDYRQYAAQTIIFGADALYKYGAEFSAPQEIRYDIGFSGRHPHYYKFDGEIYLSQNILPIQSNVQRSTIWQEHAKDAAIDPKEGFGMAISTCENWKRDAVNGVAASAGGAAISVYKYARPTEDFKSERIENMSGESTPQKVFAYKIRGVPKYTALLNLSRLNW